ncbi:MAG: holo-[acyl-carrier-protein] synthase [Deltaproteobacteria bacterium]|nr:MAG: holo-[acyl-carrier-protein] synthase [Deltaproteobacteria bacterium]
MIRGIGVDVVRISRFRKAMDRWQKRFLERIFSEEERAECRKWRDPAPHLAVKFAAKEAFSKAMGTGFGAALSLRDIQVLHDPLGGPTFVVSEKARGQMKMRGIEKALLSLSHDADMGIAFVVMEG